MPHGLIGRVAISYNQPLAGNNCKLRSVINERKTTPESAKPLAHAASHNSGKLSTFPGATHRRTVNGGRPHHEAWIVMKKGVGRFGWAKERQLLGCLDQVFHGVVVNGRACRFGRPCAEVPRGYQRAFQFFGKQPTEGMPQFLGVPRIAPRIGDDGDVWPADCVSQQRQTAVCKGGTGRQSLPSANGHRGSPDTERRTGSFAKHKATNTLQIDPEFFNAAKDGDPRFGLLRGPMGNTVGCKNPHLNVARSGID